MSSTRSENGSKPRPQPPASWTATDERSSKKRSSPPSPPRGSSASDSSLARRQDRNLSSERAAKPFSHNHEQTSNVEKGDTRLSERDEPVLRDENTPPSKRIKSDIAPWMTQRHKRAIRRSLEAGITSSSPVKSTESREVASPAKGGREPHEMEEHKSETSR